MSKRNSKAQLIKAFRKRHKMSRSDFDRRQRQEADKNPRPQFWWVKK